MSSVDSPCCLMITVRDILLTNINCGISQSMNGESLVTNQFLMIHALLIWDMVSCREENWLKIGL
jgi:hypothetical protein